jgi:hypothetical protein
MMNHAFILLVFIASAAIAQVAPPEEPSTITLGDIKLEQGKLPGSERVWTKIIIGFASSERWSDGLLLSAMVALESEGRVRIANGDLRFANIPAGTHNAIFYLTPNAVARFGNPVAIRIMAFAKDREVGEKVWQNPRSASFNQWEVSNVYAGILLPLHRTPWLLIDYDRSPDVVTP